MTPDIAAIVAKLTPGVRDALARAELDGNLGRYFTRWTTVKVGKALVKQELGTAVWSGVMLSSLGEQVRAALALEQGS